MEALERGGFDGVAFDWETGEGRGHVTAVSSTNSCPSLSCRALRGVFSLSSLSLSCARICPPIPTPKPPAAAAHAAVAIAATTRCGHGFFT